MYSNRNPRKNAKQIALYHFASPISSLHKSLALRTNTPLSDPRKFADSLSLCLSTHPSRSFSSVSR